MEFAIGIGLAFGVGVFATLTGLDRDRAFYPTVMIVVASYYDLFAIMAGGEALGAESIAFIVFAAAAVIGFRKSLWIVAAALLAHGLFDLIHHNVIANAGVPRWWPGFCLGYDASAAGYLAWRLLRTQLASAA